MRKQNRIPSALKHGIYSGLGLLPTESRAKFRKFKKQRFAELDLTGPLEQDIGGEIVCLEWAAKIYSLMPWQSAREIVAVQFTRSGCLQSAGICPH